MNKFTPGPWEVVDHECYPGIIVVKGPASPITIVTSATDIDPAGHVRRVSDARLIAAAPDLLEALEAIIASECRQPDVGCAWTKARAAIARARGEA